MIRFLRTLFWIVLFLTATFLWIVFFEHGLAGFSEGVKAEFRGLRALFNSG